VYGYRRRFNHKELATTTKKLGHTGEIIWDDTNPDGTPQYHDVSKCTISDGNIS
jgi:hypothetical protein